MRSPRVLFIHHGSSHGGAPLCLLDLIRGLRQEGVDACVACLRGRKDAIDLFSREGLEVRELDLEPFANTIHLHYAAASPRDWLRLANWARHYRTFRGVLEQAIEELQPDVVYLNSVTLTPYTVVAARRGLPCVLHVREPVYSGLLGLRRRWFTRLLNTQASHVIAISRDNLSRLHLQDGKAQVVFDLVDFSVFDHRLSQAGARERLGLPQDARVVLFAGGSVSAIKGRDDFLKAMAEVARSEPRLLCLMPSFNPNEYRDHVPSGPLGRAAAAAGVHRRRQARLDRLVGDPSLEGRVVSTPFRFDIEQFIAASDVVCVPHIVPHCSLTVNQAGAMKKPVVAYRIGGVEEMVVDGETGLLVGLRDVRGLARSVRTLLSDPELSARLGEGGYRQAAEMFDARQGVARILEVLRSLLPAAPPAPPERAPDPSLGSALEVPR